MEVKVIDKSFGDYSNSIIVETKIDGEKQVFDVRIDFQKMKISISGFGVKKGRQRNFVYPKFDDWDYRKLDSEERSSYADNYYRQRIPAEVANLAIQEFLDSIQIDRY